MPFATGAVPLAGAIEPSSLQLVALIATHANLPVDDGVLGAPAGNVVPTANGPGTLLPTLQVLVALQ